MGVTPTFGDCSTGIDNLPRATVATTAARSYMDLLSGAAASGLELPSQGVAIVRP